MIVIKIENSIPFFCITSEVVTKKQEDEGETTRRTPRVEYAILKSEEPENQKAMSIEDLQQKGWDWRYEYHNERPHSSLGMQTPKEFLESGDKKERFAV